MKAFHVYAVMAILVGTCVSNASADPGLVPEAPTDGPIIKTDSGYMIPYTETIPGTDITFEMVPIPGGEFLMGSPDDEANRNEDEGPQFAVIVEPFWMGRYEVTWREYKTFMDLYHAIKRLQSDEFGLRRVTDENMVDAVTLPTPLYVANFTFELGDADNEPAVTMTPYAARQYTKWLSLLIDRFYRLPSEAEWEYAAQAGTSTAFSFGNGMDKLDGYGWYWDNSIKVELDLEAYHPVGSKMPNAWGLYDMHGNVSELVLDEYREDHYKRFTGKTVKWDEAIAWPTKRQPRVHRGGSWYADADRCRSSARGQTDDVAWKTIDPQRPRSPWWYSEPEGRAVGMRLLRPLHAPADRDQRNRYWEEDTAADVRADIDQRLDGGQAAIAPIDPQLPEDLDKLKQ